MNRAVVRARTVLACNHSWGAWETISTHLQVRRCTKCGATQENRRS